MNYCSYTVDTIFKALSAAGWDFKCAEKYFWFEMRASSAKCGLEPEPGSD